jgi:hypothetical protein
MSSDKSILLDRMCGEMCHYDLGGIRTKEVGGSAAGGKRTAGAQGTKNAPDGPRR